LLPAHDDQQLHFAFSVYHTTGAAPTVTSNLVRVQENLSCASFIQALFSLFTYHNFIISPGIIDKFEHWDKVKIIKIVLTIWDCEEWTESSRRVAEVLNEVHNEYKVSIKLPKEEGYYFPA